eukprot:TRINITY_DN30632_c0_g2_i2.p1 TRINITY_DN30632_c0_g2~~TRINITY_DN30632_c0_g2_i2.p1  ORF type:complete len:575 (-),score=128.70 TRINITY_DN30632_c0_g2_i2:355-2079(-)
MDDLRRQHQEDISACVSAELREWQQQLRQQAASAAEASVETAVAALNRDLAVQMQQLQAQVTDASAGLKEHLANAAETSQDVLMLRERIGELDVCVARYPADMESQLQSLQERLDHAIQELSGQRLNAAPEASPTRAAGAADLGSRAADLEPRQEKLEAKMEQLCRQLEQAAADSKGAKALVERLQVEMMTQRAKPDICGNGASCLDSSDSLERTMQVGTIAQVESAETAARGDARSPAAPAAAPAAGESASGPSVARLSMWALSAATAVSETERNLQPSAWKAATTTPAAAGVVVETAVDSGADRQAGSGHLARGGRAPLCAEALEMSKGVIASHPPPTITSAAPVRRRSLESQLRQDSFASTDTTAPPAVAAGLAAALASLSPEVPGPHLHMGGASGGSEKLPQQPSQPQPLQPVSRLQAFSPAAVTVSPATSSSGPAGETGGGQPMGQANAGGMMVVQAGAAGLAPRGTTSPLRAVNPRGLLNASPLRSTAAQAPGAVPVWAHGGQGLARPAAAQAPSLAQPAGAAPLNAAAGITPAPQRSGSPRTAAMPRSVSPLPPTFAFRAVTGYRGQ